MINQAKSSNSFGSFVALAFVLGIGIVMWHAWKDSETRALPVHMRANSWLAGEYKICFSVGKGPDNADREFSQDIADMISLDCDAEETNETHELQVKFTKSLLSNDGEKEKQTWNCQRQQSSDGTTLNCRLKETDQQ
jgi:hypothetical protein